MALIHRYPRLRLLLVSTDLGPMVCGPMHGAMDE